MTSHWDFFKHKNSNFIFIIFMFGFGYVILTTFPKYFDNILAIVKVATCCLQHYRVCITLHESSTWIGNSGVGKKFFGHIWVFWDPVSHSHKYLDQILSITLVTYKKNPSLLEISRIAYVWSVTCLSDAKGSKDEGPCCLLLFSDGGVGGLGFSM